MAGGGQDLPPQVNGGEFLLQLIQRPPHHQSFKAPIIDSGASLQRAEVMSQNLSNDPAVAALGPQVPFNSLGQLLPNSRDLPYHSHPWCHSPNFTPLNFFGAFPQNPSHIPIPIPVTAHNFPLTPSPPRHPEFFRSYQNDPNLNQRRPFPSNHKQESGYEHDEGINFGSFPIGIRPVDMIKERVTINLPQEGVNGSSLHVTRQHERVLPSASPQFQKKEQDHRQIDIGGLRRQDLGGNYRSPTKPQGVNPPPGFPSKTSPTINLVGSVQRIDKHKNNPGHLQPNYFASSSGDRREISLPNLLLGGNNQLDLLVPPTGSKLHSESATAIEETITELHGKTAENGTGSVLVSRDNGCDDLDEQIIGSLTLEDNIVVQNAKKKRDKDYRSDTRGQFALGQRMRNFKRQLPCRHDIDQFTAPFLAVYDSLVPPEEEKAKQRQLIALLERLVKREWPDARLYLYGSCANSFGVSKSDIDVCLELKDLNINKSEVLLKLAQILKSDNLQNVQALIRARVPIVKLLDPATGISCDICLNNLLAVVNTKLLRDYAQIDVRLRQLAFIVKHWAKSRGVNETYQGTLSSYAYVLMCINFLQMRRPAILPCLQEMEATYAVKVEDIHCSYFDQVEKLSGYGSANRESIARLVWSFFNYWAYFHDYPNNVISVGNGCLLRKHEKDWTRRIGNDRHLICIEDPFERSHDLGRVVDKRSIKVLREEFERAAEIMQNDPNPFVTLFEPYIPSPS